MNRKIYWKIRKRILSILFKCKVLTYKSTSNLESTKDYIPFRLKIVKEAIWGLIKGIVIATILLFIDGLLLKTGFFVELRNDIFVAVVIGCLSITGVILGLYCANISSIYSSKYANAPDTVSTAFQNDKLTKRCISTIIDYIVFGFIVIVEILLNCPLCFGTVLATIFGSIVVIISYSIAGNRAYRLSDVYNVADDSYVLLHRIIAHNLDKKIYSTDISFQHHFLKISEGQIKLLNEIQKFGESLQENNNAAMVQFMCKNIALVGTYWKVKRNIAKDSYWFRNIQKYKKWHLADGMEASNALRTGTLLQSKAEHDYWWFENEIFAINRRCIIHLCNQNDYSSLYTYLSCFDILCEIAISNKEINYFIGQINFLREFVEKIATSTEKKNEDENKTFAGIIELISLLYLGIILESGKYFKDFDIKRNISTTIATLDKGKSLDRCKLLRGKEQSGFYNNILIEVQVEKKRLTPDWLIAQTVAKEAHAYINSLEDSVIEGIDNVFTLGQFLYSQKLLFEACIILMRFYEYESKLSRFIEIVEFRENEFSEYHTDKALVWEEPHIGKLKQAIERWKKAIPTLLFKCSSEFTIKTWEMRDEYPDFLGECYNHICEDAVEAITQNNILQFQTDYENLSKLMLLYQEYIRTDFVMKKDVYRNEFAYYMFTSPIVEWAQIGGLAILWGEFKSNDSWRNITDATTKEIFKDSSKGIELAGSFIEYIQNRDKFWIGIGHRDFLETEWQQKVAQAIRESEEYQTEYEIYGEQIKTNSKLLKAFCRNLGNMGFTTDPSEVYWVLCINPMLPDEKKYNTKYSWEEKLNA